MLIGVSINGSVSTCYECVFIYADGCMYMLAGLCICWQVSVCAGRCMFMLAGVYVYAGMCMHMLVGVYLLAGVRIV